MGESRQIYVWDRLLLQLGVGIKNRRHRHFGAFLLVAPDSPLEVNVESLGRIESQVVLVAPNTWHSLDARGGRVATIIVGADHPWFSYVTRALNQSAAVTFDVNLLSGLHADWNDLFDGRIECDVATRFFKRVFATLVTERIAPHALDPRIAKALELLDLDGAHAASVASLGRRVGLTEFTFMRIFKRELGVRIREYILWRRLIRAIPLLSACSTLTEVAHLAGFYDQAHLTRTARRLFDVQPSSVVDPRSARIHVCRCGAHTFF